MIWLSVPQTTWRDPTMQKFISLHKVISQVENTLINGRVTLGFYQDVIATEFALRFSGAKYP
jgi:hypothetical protein